MTAKTQTEINVSYKDRNNAVGIFRTTLWLPEKLIPKFHKMAEEERKKHKINIEKNKK